MVRRWQARQAPDPARAPRPLGSDAGGDGGGVAGVARGEQSRSRGAGHPTRAMVGTGGGRHRSGEPRLVAVDVDDHAGWRAAAEDAAGILAEWSLRVEGARPGPLAAASDALARSAQRPWGCTGAPWKGPRLAGQHLQLAARATSTRSWQGWKAVMLQLDRTTQAIHRAHTARGEAVATQRVAAAAGQGLSEVRERMRALDVEAGTTRAVPSKAATKNRPEHDRGR